MWCDTILEPSPPFHFSTCETDWPPFSNDRQVLQKSTQLRDWSTLYKKLLQCIRSSDGPDQWSHWTKQGQTKFLIRLKKKYFVSKLARIFQTDAACVFLFFVLFFFYFNWPLPPRTSETKNDWKVSISAFSEIKRDFTRFLSSHVLKFFQNSKLSSFFVVKMIKKNNFKKKIWKSEFCKIKCAQKNKCGRQLWDTEFFFF